jgi:RNA-directed DNA polymerase
LLLRALEKHTDCKWVKLYIRRWLTAPLQRADGTMVERTKGTPQGGIVSPVAANLFLHYAFDTWMNRTFPGVPWCRYADDGLVHCKSETEALAIKAALQKRFAECNLEMHPEKTHIAYCKDEHRKREYPNTEFDFLGYTFRRRSAKNHKHNTVFMSFSPGVSASALKSMRAKTRKENFRNRAELSLQDISRLYNPILRGWIAYYGKFHLSALYPLFKYVNEMLVVWAMRKYRLFEGHKKRARLFIENIAKEQPYLFAHWSKGGVGGDGLMGAV